MLRIASNRLQCRQPKCYRKMRCLCWGNTIKPKELSCCQLCRRWRQTPCGATNDEYHNTDVMMTAMASQITSPTIVFSTVYSGADLRKHQSSVSLPFVRGIHRSPVNSPHKGPVTRKMFPFDDVIMCWHRDNSRCGRKLSGQEWRSTTRDAKLNWRDPKSGSRNLECWATKFCLYIHFVWVSPN